MRKRHAGSAMASWRARPLGVGLFMAVCAASTVWAWWDVQPLGLWFWPLIPRLFALGVLLWLVLWTARPSSCAAAAAPTTKHPATPDLPPARGGWRWARWTHA
ncbi:MAG: hypothetical protein LCH73_06575 [Proteobacteria bacterium]|nr:hypothetical protein [Pseudomonadota bacterium]